MTQEAIHVAVSFAALVEAIRQLSIDDKQRLADIIEEQIACDEEAWERSPEVEAEVEQARREYRAGEYVTIDELIAEAQEQG